MFGHGKFGAYHDSIEFVAFVAELIEKLPDGPGNHIDQFRRASLSIPLNIAEGSGKTTDLQKRQHYAIARGEAMECAAIIDVLVCLGLVDLAKAQQAKALLEKISAILTSVYRRRNPNKDL